MGIPIPPPWVLMSLVLGFAGHLQDFKELAGLGLEGFRIAPLPNGCFAVSGDQGAKRGAMYGVYELLE